MRYFSQVKDDTETSQFPYLLRGINAKIPINIVKEQCQSMEAKSHHSTNLDTQPGSCNAPGKEKIAVLGGQRTLLLLSSFKDALSINNAINAIMSNQIQFMPTWHSIRHIREVSLEYWMRLHFWSISEVVWQLKSF